MGTFERLSVVVIGVILVMILVVAVVTWTEEPEKGCLPPEDNGLIAELPPAPLPDPLPLPDPTPVPAPKPEPKPEPKPDPVPADVKTHVVAPGETPSQIAGKYYPSSKYWRQLLAFNQIEGDVIRTGQNLKIPPLEALGITNDPSKIAVEPSSPASGKGPTPGHAYTVRKNEDLIKIAKAAYRDPTRWPDIWLANRERLPKPEDIREGMVLDLPN